MQRLAGQQSQPPTSPKSSHTPSIRSALLVYLLWAESFHWNSIDISTDGIDICDWEVHPSLTEDLLPVPDDRLVFSCWDFAGQEVREAEKRGQECTNMIW